MSGKAIVKCVFTVTLLVLAVAGARADVFNMPAGQTSLQTVFVGDPGNVADTGGQVGAGAVGYNYYIGTYDVTNAQYCQFLNAKLPNISDPVPGGILANDNYTSLPSDTYGLYNPAMSLTTDPNVGIAYDPNAPTGAKFSPMASRANWPVVDVNWMEALRFVNWLQNGQGNGDTESGTYQITNGGQNTGSLPYPIRSGETPSATGHWVLPSQDEWYKAAYYKGGGTNSGYWLYPTQSNYPPTDYPPGQNPNPANAANYYQSNPPGYPKAADHPIDVGSYPDSVSAYGALDMGGNASQWNEMPANYEGLLGGSDYSMVEVRGGNCDTSVNLLQSPNYNCHNGTGGGALDNMGFRVAYVPDTEVPEPASMTLVVAGGLCLLAYRWRRRHV